MIILKIMLLSWFFSNFEPLKWLIDWTIKNKALKFILTDIFSCMKCLSLWIGLILTQSIWISLTASFLSYVYLLTIHKWLNKTKVK